MNTNKLEEKLELAEELGLTEFKRSALMVKEAMSLKFKCTTVPEVHREIMQMVWRAYRWVVIAGYLRFVFAVISAAAFFATISMPKDSLVLAAICISSMLIFTACEIVKIEFTFEVYDMSLEKWGHDLPYGAMLAVKEAKDAGCRNFYIFFPVKSSKKVSADPIITAMTKNGNLVKVFAWDDSKIYE